MTASGGHLHHAPDSEAACRIIVEIADQQGVRTAVKSKSMTTEEVHLNSALENAGIGVRETDLGEYIVQLSNDRPSHIIAPIIHKSIEDVRQAFREGLAVDEVPETPEELTQLARRLLREDFLSADMGITGANFLLADTGTVVIVENEGNACMTIQLPRLHVVLAGVEKILPSASDLMSFLQLLPRAATGQLQTTYLSFISGPGWSSSPFVEGEREFHVVLLDNGRMGMREDPLLREALYCIRCGACMTACPPYQVLGGHVYGGPTYHSGIGAAWEAGVRGLETAAGFADLCTTCSRCQDVCPVRIDIPWMNSVLRDRIGSAHRPRRRLFESVVARWLLPDDESRGVKLGARFFGNPARIYRLARATAPLSTWLIRRPAVRRLLQSAVGLDAGRPLPLPSGASLTDWHRGRGGKVIDGAGSSPTSGAPVILFADCHTDNVDVGVGKAAIDVLEGLGHEIALLTGHCCGRAALSQGLLGTARRQAEQLQETLEPLAAAGCQIVGIEPSCFSAIVDDHRKLVGDAAERVAGACHDLLEFLATQIQAVGGGGKVAVHGEEENGGGELPASDGEEVDRNDDMQRGDRQPIVALLHGHCQQKTCGWLAPTVAALEGLGGVDVRTTSTECCGMAGSFGYKRDFSGVSIELGRRLVAELESLEADLPGGGDPDTVEYLACGTSCRAQLRDLSGRVARHPIELIAERLRGALRAQPSRG